MFIVEALENRQGSYGGIYILRTTKLEDIKH